jgi:hypothetical protein
MAVLVESETSPVALYEFARQCRRDGRLDLWRRALASALAMPHHSHQERFLRGNARLLLDDWAGWSDRETRIYDPVSNYLGSDYMRAIRFNVRAWDGSEGVHDQTLLLVADGTVGDGVRMLRYIPMVSSRASRVIVSVRPELASIVRRAYGDCVTVALIGIPHTERIDRYAWMMSLPALIGELPEWTPLPGVIADDQSSHHERPPRVGICWEGDPNTPVVAGRSVPIELLRTHLFRDGLQWIGLRTNSPVSEQTLQEWLSPPPTPLYSCAHIAQTLVSLDVVVTVDATVAHIAGALGKPTWVLLDADADPRWGIGRTTPWYPSLTLIRQRTSGDWSEALRELRIALDGFAGGQHAHG